MRLKGRQSCPTGLLSVTALKKKCFYKISLDPNIENSKKLSIVCYYNVSNRKLNIETKKKRQGIKTH
jgi:hypothetical protein